MSPILKSKLSAAIAGLQEPYKVDAPPLPGLDFNRELVSPGTNAIAPDGAVILRVDADFWIVAVLPWEYRELPLKDVVEVLYPEFVEQASFDPDSGTVEQTIFYLQSEVETLKLSQKHLEEQNREYEKQVKRLKSLRPEINSPSPTRRRKMQQYFIARYTELLDATAHAHLPKAGFPGLCAECGLLSSDRVHMERYITRRREKGPTGTITDYIGKPDDDPEWSG